MRKNLRIFGKLWKIQFRNYWTDITNIVLGLVLTTFTLFCWLLFTEKGVQTDRFLLASAIGVSVVRNSLYNFGRTINDFNNKHLVQTFLHTPISKRIIGLSMIIFNLVTNIFVIAILFALAMCFPDQRIYLQSVNWLMFFSSLFLMVLMSNLMAIIVVFSFKNNEVIISIFIWLYFIPFYMLGLGVPYYLINSNTSLNIITYFFPHRYVLNLMQAGWIGDTTMSYPLGDGTFAKNGFGYLNQLWIPYLATIILIVIFMAIIVVIFYKNFSYNARRYKGYPGIYRHLNHIYRIQQATSKEQLEEIIKYQNNKKHSGSLPNKAPRREIK
ncbi:hypothetical protein SSABA_v1c05980 [Spiroplasma sabaudiense Ar-1343]|uniref:Uncharacterized protein n=1 Tax=Spiroplasma sabaudiense Ar-1343 TaxID=1276257 RepID=W6AAB5_9MOLU|nr:hypothetical protein [Spiroplasma sabaudiense]AHI54002.1 hypothetical protein SSABA_v1c05980 [Spiroplasma sabaudiense Ar-1343]